MSNFGNEVIGALVKDNSKREIKCHSYEHYWGKSHLQIIDNKTLLVFEDCAISTYSQIDEITYVLYSWRSHIQPYLKYEETMDIYYAKSFTKSGNTFRVWWHREWHRRYQCNECFNPANLRLKDQMAGLDINTNKSIGGYYKGPK